MGTFSWEIWIIFSATELFPAYLEKNDFVHHRSNTFGPYLMDVTSWRGLISEYENREIQLVVERDLVVKLVV